jgi:methylmalonyl-CoA mutase cobalamin-binding domain/chain
MPVPAAPRADSRTRPPVRLLTAVPLCDGHDSAITTINLELARRGAEVIYLGYHQSASAIARAAVQEDVHAVGLSSYNGGHAVFFKEVLTQLRKRGAGDIAVFGGGGGTITPADERVIRRAGVDRIFFAGTPLDEMVETICRRYGRPLRADGKLEGDRALARQITLVETGNRRPKTGNKNRPEAPVSKPLRSPVSKSLRFPVSGFQSPHSPVSSYVLGVCGPGGAGKSTLIDELTARFLRARPSGRIAILANDPSHPESGGAVLGDRVSAIYAQDDRVFFRSLATRGNLTGLSAAAPRVIELLRCAGEFDLVFVESIGIGQESDPFGVFGATPLVDAVLFVLPPHYGGRIQLQKIALLERADFVALNKCDDPRATAAKTELTTRLASRHERSLSRLFPTIAAEHEDGGVEALFAAIADHAGLGDRGGEKACQLVIQE